MTHTHDRLRHGQAGAVGMMIIVWLAVVVVVGITAIDAVDRVHEVPARGRGEHRLHGGGERSVPARTP
jgi:hypothetical protein